jgi:proteasome assembly chaperone (PAC2) family protein
MKGPLNIFRQTDFRDSAMVVGWGSDVGKLGEAVSNYLIKKLNGQLFYEIEPHEYFQLGSVTIEDDMVQFPESKFYFCPQNNLVIFISAPPAFELYNFLYQVLDIAQNYCSVKEIYAVGGIPSLNTHTVPRQIFGSFNSPEVKKDLCSYDIYCDLDYETPIGQKPTINSYLLWASRKRSLAGIDLSVPVPFYFAALDDFKAQKKILEFFNQRFQIDIDLSVLDEAINNQNKKFNELLYLYPEVNDYFMRLESNLRLSEDDNLKMVKMIEEYLKEK